MPNLLYVDDEADIREIAIMSLELDGDFSVTGCGSGQQALDALARGQPDAVLLDVMMPGMDGPDTLAALRTAGYEGPILFCTARTQQADIDRLLALGAWKVIAKPFDPMGLAEQIREAIRIPAQASTFQCLAG